MTDLKAAILAADDLPREVADVTWDLGGERLFVRGLTASEKDAWVARTMPSRRVRVDLEHHRRARRRHAGRLGRGAHLHRRGRGGARPEVIGGVVDAVRPGHAAERAERGHGRGAGTGFRDRPELAFAHRLALALGMTVGEVGRMPALEVARWAAFESTFGPITVQERIDAAMARIAYTTHASAGGKEPFEKFVPQWRRPQRWTDEADLVLARRRGEEGRLMAIPPLVLRIYADSSGRPCRRGADAAPGGRAQELHLPELRADQDGADRRGRVRAQEVGGRGDRGAERPAEARQLPAERGRVLQGRPAGVHRAGRRAPRPDRRGRRGDHRGAGVPDPDEAHRGPGEVAHAADRGPLPEDGRGPGDGCEGRREVGQRHHRRASADGHHRGQDEGRDRPLRGDAGCARRGSGLRRETSQEPAVEDPRRSVRGAAGDHRPGAPAGDQRARQHAAVPPSRRPRPRPAPARRRSGARRVVDARQARRAGRGASAPRRPR